MDLVDGIKWYLVFLFSTCCHEAAHAWAAWKLGDPTAMRGGQASLDPVPHLRREPVGMIVAPLLSYFGAGWMIGWASAPFDPEWALRYPRRAARMALAGPLANLGLFLAAALLLRLGLEWGWFHPVSSPSWIRVAAAADGWAEFAAKMTSLVFSLNLILGLFNLLPLPPLDGSALAMAVLPERLARSYFQLRRHPLFALGGIYAAWQLFALIQAPVYRAAVKCLYLGL